MNGRIVRDGLEGASGFVLYVTSVYWSVTTLSTVGYGDIFASTVLERAYCILVMLTGATLYALAIGALSHIITIMVAKHSHSKKIEQRAAGFITMHSLPSDLSEEILQKVNRTGLTKEMEKQSYSRTLELLPEDLRTRALLCIFRKEV
ncbi:unnamed protein product, partial [Discosporangium mesarthrocarpum]